MRAAKLHSDIYNAIVDTAAEVVILTNEQDKIVTFDPTAVMKVFGYSVAELAGSDIRILLPEMSQARLDAFLEARGSLPRDNPEFVLGALGGRQPGATLAGSDAYRVRMRVVLSDGRQSRPEGIIMILGPGEKEAYRIFTWRSGLDQMIGRPPQAGEN